MWTHYIDLLACNLAMRAAYERYESAVRTAIAGRLARGEKRQGSIGHVLLKGRIAAAIERVADMAEEAMLLLQELTRHINGRPRPMLRRADAA